MITTTPIERHRQRKAAMLFYTAHEFTPTMLYVRDNSSSRRGRMGKPFVLYVALLLWLREQGWTQISADGQTWHTIADLLHEGRSREYEDRKMHRY